MKKQSFSISNRKARYDYEILETLVAGIQLLGTEIKSIRAGQASINDAYCFFDNGEAFVKNMQIQPLQDAVAHEPGRVRKLLLNKKEIEKLNGKMQKGLTVVVLEVFEMSGKAKLRIALAKGKKNYDKRETIKKRDIEREINRKL